MAAVVAMSRGGRPWSLKELWEFWKREEGLRFISEGNRFEKVVLGFEGFLLSVWKFFGFVNENFLGLDAKKIHEKKEKKRKKEKEDKEKGRK